MEFPENALLKIYPVSNLVNSPKMDDRRWMIRAASSRCGSVWRDKPINFTRRLDDADHERRHEAPGLSVVEAEIFLQRRQHGREHEAVEVIEQVEAGEDDQNPGGRELLALDGGGHRLQS